MPSKIKPLFVLFALALCLLGGCQMFQGGKGQISAVAIEAPMTGVMQRHDAYVTADANLTDVEKTTFLRSSELVKKAMDTALERNPAVPPPG